MSIEDKFLNHLSCNLKGETEEDAEKLLGSRIMVVTELFDVL